MSDDGESFAASPPPEIYYSSDDDDAGFAAPPVVEVPVRRGGRVGRPRAPDTEATVGVWLVTETAVQPAAGSADVLRETTPQKFRAVVGLALVHWSYEPSGEGVAPTVARGPGAGRRAQAAAWGAVRYDPHACWTFEEEVDLGDEVALDSAVSHLTLRQMCGAEVLNDIGGTVHGFCSQHDREFNKVMVLEEDVFCRAMREEMPTLLRNVPLKHRVAWDQLVPYAPPQASVGRWRKDAKAGQGAAGRAGHEEVGARSSGSTLLHVPPKRARVRESSAPCGNRPAQLRKDMDPVHLVNALDFTKYLRNQSDFSPAMQAAATYNAGPAAAEVTRDASNDPRRSNLMRARERIDFVGMAVERRIFHEEMETDAVESIHCYSDASPVTGSEIQGMIAELVLRDGRLRRVALPCGSLSYGHFDDVNKGMCFLFGVWMVFGPLLKHMEYFCSKVLSWTTDFGVEMLSVLLPGVLVAFLAWNSGTLLQLCAPLVDFSVRCFPRSLRIAGWSHGLGNVMKKDCDGQS